MSKSNDSPKYIDVKKTDDQQKEEAIEKIKALYHEQSFGVLATQGDKDAHTSLISFVVKDDFSQLIFASPSDTKKVDAIKQNQEVSILVDNRNHNPETINDIIAISAKGQAKILDKKPKEISNALVKKHHYLNNFIDAASTVLVSVDIANYYYVSSFQETFEWSPR